MIQVYGGGEHPAYTIDEETLREELLSEEDTREWLAEVPDDPHAVSFWRMLGELDRALETGRRHLAARAPGTGAWAAAALRVAHVHHWRGEYAEAHRLMDAAEEAFAGEDEQGMTAFVQQHRAKTLFDEGRVAEAEEQAGRALAARTDLFGPIHPVTVSSRQTLDRIRRESRNGGAA